MFQSKTDENKLKLSTLDKFGADKQLISTLLKKGLLQLRKIQEESIQKGLFQNVSFFICSPSGSGKTLIGEMASINNILKKKGTSLYLVPLRALAGEKAAYFSETYGILGIKVVMAVGDNQIPLNDLKKADLLIMTYEKFDSYLRLISENDWIYQINTLIIDEIHFIGEQKRGSRLETLLVRTFLRVKEIQLIALSATVANPNDLGNWLKSLCNTFSKNQFEIISSDVRPVELDYAILPTNDKIKTIKELAKKLICEKGQILIFTNSRRRSEDLAKELSPFIAQSFNLEYNPIYKEEFETIINTLESENNDALLKLLRTGIGFHHAGLESKERYAVEKLFVNGIIKVIVCTTTLSAGINTPARMVILEDVEIFDQDKSIDEQGKVSNNYSKQLLDRNVFHQILGRAGRPGYDSEGYARILANSNSDGLNVQEHYFDSKTKDNKNIFVPKYDEITSQLFEKNNLLEFILLCIFEQNAINIDDLYKLIGYSYFTRLKQESDSFKGLIFDIMDGEIFQIVKTYSNFEDLLHNDSDSYETNVSKLETQLLEGSVIDLKNNSRYNIRFEADRGIYCDCTKKFQKKTSNSNSNDKITLCKHQISFLRYLSSYIESNEFVLKSPINHSNKMEIKENFNLDLKTAADILEENKKKPSISPDSIPIIISSNDQNLYPEQEKIPISRLVAKNLIEKVVNRAIRSDNIIDYLIKNSFITQINNSQIKSDNKTRLRKIEDDEHLVKFEIDEDPIDNAKDLSFKCTDLGSCIVKNYIFPSSALIFRDNLLRLFDLIDQELTDKLSRTIEHEPSLEENPLNIESKLFEIIINLLNQEDRYIPPLPQYILQLRCEGNSLGEINKIVNDKIDAEGKKVHLYYVDLKNFTEYAGKMFKFAFEFGQIYVNQFLDVKSYQNKKQYYQAIKSFESLNYQVSLGIEKNLVFLARLFKDFDETILKSLYNAGFTDKTALSNLSASELSKLTSIPRSDAEKILKKIKKPETS